MLFPSPVKWKREEQLHPTVFQAICGSSFLCCTPYGDGGSVLFI